MPCVFCGYPHVTKEHVLATWIKKAVPEECRGPIDHWWMTPKLHETRKTRRQESLYSEQVRRVCQDECNGGWMSRLEGAAKPTLIPMFHGHSCELDRAAQDAVGRWAAKTALMACYLQPETDIPPNYPERFYREKQPPPITLVWAAKTTGGEIESFRRQGVAFPGKPLPTGAVFPKDLSGYTVTINVCRLAFKVLALSQPPGRYRINVDFNPVVPGVVPIWPPADTTIRWPPPPGVDPVGLIALATSQISLRIVRLPSPTRTD